MLRAPARKLTTLSTISRLCVQKTSQAMNRPRNRQPRPQRENNRGTNNTQKLPRTPVPNRNRDVPTIQQVIPGAAVSIVLKADQSTGREVQGAVKDVLTRGDHPRGIKVRLQDGRIGRVQRMAAGGVTTSVDSVRPKMQQSSLAAEQFGERFRASDQYEFSSETRNMNFDNRSDAPSPAERRPISSTVVNCPICENFEGDETAVSHHVQEHLDGETETLG